MAEPENPPTTETASDASLDALREFLRWCQANPQDPEALAQFNELREHLVRPELGDDVLTTAEVLSARVLADEAPRPADHAHMTILLSWLLGFTAPKHRDRVDALLVQWIRHPASHGPDRATPPDFQKPEFVQRAANIIGWGGLDPQKDAEALGRFMAWVNTWRPKEKQQVRRPVEMLRRNFPSEAWKRVRFF